MERRILYGVLGATIVFGIIQALALREMTADVDEMSRQVGELRAAVRDHDFRARQDLLLETGEIANLVKERCK